MILYSVAQTRRYRFGRPPSPVEVTCLVESKLDPSFEEFKDSEVDSSVEGSE